jgi:hypothetical protein
LLFRGLMTTSPQCFGAAPGFTGLDFWVDGPASDGGVVVILTGTTSLGPPLEEAGDTGPRRVA